MPWDRPARSDAAPAAEAGLLAAACESDTDSGSGSAPATQGTTASGGDAGDSGGGGGGGGGGDTGAQRNPGDAYEEYGIYERVEFSPGASGTTVSDGVVRGTVNGYLFGAAAGQRMTATLDSPNAVFDVDAPDDTPLAIGVVSGVTEVVDPLPADGDYLVVVGSTAGNASFDLVVEITSPGGGSTAAAEFPDCGTYTEFENYPLKMCDKGPIVVTVQEGLQALGYPVDADGLFGPGTAAAISEVFGEPTTELIPPDIEAIVLAGE